MNKNYFHLDRKNYFVRKKDFCHYMTKFIFCIIKSNIRIFYIKILRTTMLSKESSVMCTRLNETSTKMADGEIMDAKAKKNSRNIIQID